MCPEDAESEELFSVFVIGLRGRVDLISQLKVLKFLVSGSSFV